MNTLKMVLTAASSVALLACGGGGSGSGSSGTSAPANAISGLAAVGAALAYADVSGKCVSGTVSGQTDANGAFNLPTSGITAPCLLKVSGGSPSVTLYGFASAAGHFNISPITNLIVNRALGSAPGTAFGTFGTSEANTISAALSDAKTYVLGHIQSMTGAAYSGDPMTGSFAVGDSNDKVLEKLSYTLAAANKTLDDLSTQAQTAANLAAAAPLPTPTITAANMSRSALLAAIDAAGNGATIVLPPGKFAMDGPVSISGKTGITLVGAGNGTDPTTSTILTFKDALSQNGVSVQNSSNVVLRRFAVEDAAGNGIYANSITNLTMDTVRAEWTTNWFTTSDMAYALYPVNSDNVLVTNSIAAGSKDAGIYVGQSTNITVVGNLVYNNVAGVEIENSHEAVVDRNYAYNNTGGVLVFALPGPTRFKDNSNVKVTNNKIINNNLPPAANATGLVLTIPPGTGVLTLASQNVEIANNTITNHKTSGIVTVSALTDPNITWDPNDKDGQGKSYDPYSRAVYAHHNTISDFGSSPGGVFADPAALKPYATGYMAALAANGAVQKLAAVIWDGIVDSASSDGTTAFTAHGGGGAFASTKRICSQNNTLDTPTIANMLSYENLDLDLIALQYDGGQGNFPFPARMDCSLNLPAVNPVRP